MSLHGTACETCENRAHGECIAYWSTMGRLAAWLRFRALIPRSVARPRAPGWCPRRAHEQLPLWRDRVAS